MVEHLTAETFKEKVFDYHESEEWKFKGENQQLLISMQIGVPLAKWLHRF